MDNWTEKEYSLFWSKMLGIYGKRWAEDHGSQINDTWREIIRKITFERIKATLTLCVEAGDAHPITLSQFVSRAKSIRLNTQSENFDLLPPPNMTPEKIMANQKRLNDVANDTVRKTGQRFRSVLLPGENYFDYRNALNACSSKESRIKFDQDRLRKNGWTENDENQFRAMAHTIGMRVQP